MNPLPINDHNNHYENADYVAANVIVPEIIPNVAQIINLQQQQQQQQQHPINYRQQHPANYRNEIYERNGGYDVPRNIRNNYPFQGTQRRSNLHLDFNRPRCPMTHQQRAKYQRSFDDTESCYYGNSSQYTYKKYENMYERVKEEPLYQNATPGGQQQNMYGRLDVIGHGIGRIERHLSSSCGNIDHYNVGSHYAVVNGQHHPHVNGHSHVNNVNPVNSGAAGTQGSSKDTVKSFFSCLGGENSQSMNNINGTTSGQNPFVNPTPGSSVGPSVVRNTGAIPKSKAKANKVCPKPNNIPVAPPLPPPATAASIPSTISSAQNTLNRISKSSLQYLMVNKYLPFGPDYKIIDFNFMFSRNCQNGVESGGSLDTSDQELVRFNGQAEMVRPDDAGNDFGEFFPPPREYPTMNGNYPRIIRNTPQLGRLRECDGEIQYENLRSNPRTNNFRARSESPSFSSGSRMRNPHQLQQQQQQQMKQNFENSGQDQFRNWSFNFENNSFRPAGASGIRRITDGTLSVRDFQEQNPSKELPAVILENQSQELQEPQASSSKSSSPSISENSSNPSGPTSMTSGSSSNKSTTGELKKSENYDNLASLQQQDPAPSVNKRKKKSTESQSSDSITLMDDEDENNDDFDDLESDAD